MNMILNIVDTRICLMGKYVLKIISFWLSKREEHKKRGTFFTSRRTRRRSTFTDETTPCRLLTSTWGKRCCRDGLILDVYIGERRSSSHSHNKDGAQRNFSLKAAVHIYIIKKGAVHIPNGALPHQDNWKNNT